MNSRKVVKSLIPKKLFEKVEPAGHGVEAALVNAKNRWPARGLNVIGVTGTDGKTTTCMLIAKMLRNSGQKVAMITTVAVDYADGQGERPSPTHLTTASAGQLQAMFKKIKANQPDWVVLEVSSHALAQYRVLGVPFSVAVMTNLTHEHLDYHKTFARYRDAKVRLFKLAARNHRGLRTGVINADDPSAEYFIRAVPRSVTYGIKNGALQAKILKTTAAGSEFQVGGLAINLNLPGEFNIYNALAAIGAGQVIGLSDEQIGQGIAALKAVPGRMMRLEAGQRLEVLIDYAVTPAALENVLKAARKTTKGKVMLVFGATGDRDKAKRPVMGEVAAKFADRIFLTDDETYREDPAAIRQAVMTGIAKAGGQAKTTEVNERAAAIKQAIAKAKAGDTVLITGLGHQKDRNMGGKLIPWSDSEIAKQLLNRQHR
ncbi:MAG TPA: UDP-N-acetylmuramoyl-L-alanyl-D-glutamate--2,6-diaminopimelate ligase [Candidatus Nitrosopolaris sp.]|nr:UDP-N-acetylmuramoyl-L-alanyl-D-glutamate--2,6-diaminopimelate ligase [Candidatus Nitrosopolaris sp.]